VGVFVGAPIIALLVETRGYSAGFLASALTVAAGLAAFLLTERRQRGARARAVLAD
jgi:dipeptide/tripeptide permease